MELKDGSTKTLTDDWRKAENPRAKSEQFRAKTVFKLASESTGRRPFGKQSTRKVSDFPAPQALPDPVVKPVSVKTQVVRPDFVLRDSGECADTFRKRLLDLVSDEGENGLENFVWRSLGSPNQ